MNISEARWILFETNLNGIKCLTECFTDHTEYLLVVHYALESMLNVLEDMVNFLDGPF